MIEQTQEIVFGPLFITSIDPGFVNTGLAYAAILKTKPGVFQIILDPRKTKTLDLQLSTKLSINEIVRVAQKFVWINFIRPEELAVSQVRIEQQYFNLSTNKISFWHTNLV